MLHFAIGFVMILCILKLLGLVYFICKVGESGCNVWLLISAILLSFIMAYVALDFTIALASKAYDLPSVW